MKTELKIGGMSCEACVDHVTHALQNVPRVRHVDVTLEAPHAIVEHDGAEIQSLIAAVQNEGYTAKLS